jgi:hypothetical protein
MPKPKLVRLPNWEERLNALVSERLRAPFRWGVHDCALWGADVVEALTGLDFGAPFRGIYSDAEGAAAALRAHGGGTVVRTFDRHLPRTLPAFARRGDLVRLPRGAAAPHGALGVVIGEVALFVADAGLIRVPASAWSMAWSVG